MPLDCVASGPMRFNRVSACSGEARRGTEPRATQRGPRRRGFPLLVGQPDAWAWVEVLPGGIPTAPTTTLARREPHALEAGGLFFAIPTTAGIRPVINEKQKQSTSLKVFKSFRVCHLFRAERAQPVTGRFEIWVNLGYARLF